MFYERLSSLFFEHASFYRAITVDEYRARWMNLEFQEEEYKAICIHWNKATCAVDWNQMAYTVELYEAVTAFGSEFAQYSGWELEISTEEDEFCIDAVLN